MNRLGFRYDNLRRTLPSVLSSPNLRLEAVYTHFATADDPEHALFNDQRLRFEEACKNVQPNMRRHAANSAALLRDWRVWYDFLRPGLLLSNGIGTAAARVDDSVETGYVADQPCRRREGTAPGRSRRYRSRFSSSAPATVAVVPAGYADGLDLRLEGRGQVLIRGRRVPIIGAVSMDMMTVDVTTLDDVQPGDEVVIIGRQGAESWQQIDVREMAAAIGTIPYEIVCRVGARIEKRRYV